MIHIKIREHLLHLRSKEVVYAGDPLLLRVFILLSFAEYGDYSGSYGQF